MTKRFLFGMSVILSTAIADPVYAQAVMQGVGIGSAPSHRLDVSIVSHGTDDVMPSAPSVRPWRAGNETATRPWSAPAGHHQPSAADVHELASASQPILDQEDLNVDRIVRSVCRGC
jgi:hypothetical protein